MNALAGWLGGGDADDGSKRASAVRFHGSRALAALIVAGVTYLVFPASPVVDSPILEIGSVAPDNVIAPFGYTVSKSPEELAKEQSDIARSVEPIFSVVPAALDSSRALIDQFADGLRRAAAAPAAQRINAVEQVGIQLGVQLTPAEAQYLATPGQGDAVTAAVRRTYDRWLAAGIASSGVLDAIQGAVTLRRDTTMKSINVDSIPTFATLLLRARLLNPDPQSPAGDAAFRKLLTAFLPPASQRIRRAGSRRQ